MQRAIAFLVGEVALLLADNITSGDDIMPMETTACLWSVTRHQRSIHIFV